MERISTAGLGCGAGGDVEFAVLAQNILAVKRDEARLHQDVKQASDQGESGDSHET